MITYVLILFFHVGVMADGNSNAATTVPGFSTLQECNQAGAEVKALVKGTVKQLSFVCVKQTH